VTEYYGANNMHAKVSCTDLKLNHLYTKVMLGEQGKAQVELIEELAMRERVDGIMKRFEAEIGVTNSEVNMEMDNLDCARTMVATYKQHCGEFNEYAHGKVDSFLKACDSTTSLLSLQYSLIASC
jgi:hypothetical protein